MLCKDKITSIFCIIDDILKEINHSEDIPPLAQACSLCPIQNSQFSPRPTCPTRPTIHNSKFIIPLALFIALYSLKKRFSIWQVKRNSRAVLLYFTDC